MAKITDGFYTMKGYAMMSDGEITSAMEDYLEMIARIEKSGGHARIVDLSLLLHVKASSVTKMVQQLAKAELVSAERYGSIFLTNKGSRLGRYLLYRHDVLNRFLCLINKTGSELEQVEKIEHFINETTVKNLDLLCTRLQSLS